MSKLIFSFGLFLFLLSPSSQAIEVVFERDPTLPLVHINVAVKAGYTADPKGMSGISRFLGQMLLRGTQHRSKSQIDMALDQMGSTLGVETRAESLVMRGSVLSSELDSYLDLLYEILTEPQFSPREIEKLKRETLSKIKQTQDRDRSIANTRFIQHLFGDHPYGNIPIGKSKDIKNLTQKKLTTHYDEMFREKRLLVVGTGDATAEKLKSWANRLAQARKGGTRAPSITRPIQPQTRRLFILDKEKRTQTQIFGGLIGVKMTDPRFFPLYVGNYVFGGGAFSARMMIEIRKKRGWSYGAYSYFQHGSQPRLWLFTLFPQAAVTPEALGLTLDMIKELKRKGISKEEFEFAKSAIINSSGFRYDTPEKRIENTLIEKTIGLPEGFLKSFAKNVQSVTLKQVNQALKDYIQPDKLTLTVLATAKEMKSLLEVSANVSAADTQVIDYRKD